MPGRFFLTRPIAEIAAFLGADFEAVADEPARQNISPGQELVVYESGQLKRMRWGMIPVARVNARGRPVMETIINARSETVFQKSAFAGVRRCVIPVDGWYEWTGETRKKTAWSIRARNNAPLLFAGIADTWRGPGGILVDQVAAITCPPSADVRDIHHRMGVLMPQGSVEHWLTGSEVEVAKLMAPWPDGGLRVTQADGVDWSGP